MSSLLQTKLAKKDSEGKIKKNVIANIPPLEIYKSQMFKTKPFSNQDFCEPEIKIMAFQGLIMNIKA